MVAARRPQINERGLAGAVWSDQRMARTGGELKVDLLQGHKRAKAPAQRACFEPELGHDAVRLVR